MPFTAVNGIDVSFEVHGAGPALLNISGDPEQMIGMGRQLRARAGHDVVANLGAIDHPTLVCAGRAGRYDDIAPVANSELIAERMPNATLRVFDGGHTLMVQDRTAFPAIIEFLELDGGAW